jgi:hypothetical protein
MEAKNKPNKWELATKEQLRKKMGILNAYYLPGMEVDALYPTITPVNSFRIIFNHYFGNKFKPLPDSSYVYSDRNHLYKFIDVTNELKPHSDVE